MADSQSQIDQLSINTIRTLSIDAIQEANSGHPGAPMGLAPSAFVLWTKFLKHNPKNPDWLDRDRFVLSGGHASMLLYSLLYLSGYGLTIEDLKNFRQFGSKTPGHPEYGHTIGVETTTGPLGQGIANAVGMAMSERHLAARFNTDSDEIVDHYTYVMCGDGDLMEGVASEAVSLAGHLSLSKLICIYDDNQISIEGRTDISFSEDVAKRFDAYNWAVQKVEDGNDVDAITKAIEQAKQEDKPSIIMVRTKIAYGSPNKQDTSDAHGAPLGDEEILLTKKNLEWPSTEKFFVPSEVLDFFNTCQDKGMKAEADWDAKYDKYSKTNPGKALEWVDAVSGFLPENWDSEIPTFEPGDAMATRAASGKVLNAIARNLPTLMGGSADLAPSNKTYLDCSDDFQKDNYIGRNIRFGVREHAMAGIMSGMFLHNGVRPFGGTFLVFADYMRGSMRVASLMKLPLIYVLTHDSLAVGEDGPTHQPVEHLASLRAIPGLNVIRPCDAYETAEAWKKAVMTNDCPTALILSRQKLPVYKRDAGPSLSEGAYILSDCDNPELILIGTGSEVSICMEAKAVLSEKGVNVRVVSMPCQELFNRTSENYQKSVLPDNVKKIAVEAGIKMGWREFVGDSGDIISVDTFGASAPGSKVLAEYGFTAENIVERAESLLSK
ncbi:MAG: transketolase [Desulfobacterales bacterium]|nr:transketolase [Desulfobacterales bacterium]MCP4164097.1 transketolase [Deltaproteobacteria bacterium]